MFKEIVGKWNSNEKLMLVITLVLLILLAVKSLYIDPIHPKTEAESIFVQMIQIEMDLEPKGFMRNSTVITEQIISVKSLTEKELEEIENEGVVNPSGYKARVRRYFLWIIPYSEHYRVLTHQERK